MTNRYELMRHALGVHAHSHKNGLRWKMPYRNHFCAGDDEVKVWEVLVSDGFALCISRGREITGGARVYTVTDEGRAVALAGLTFKRRWGYGAPTNGA